MLLQAQEARNVTMETDARVTAIEVGHNSVSSAIVQTRENTLDASEALIVAENKCMIVSDPLLCETDVIILILQLEASLCF